LAILIALSSAENEQHCRVEQAELAKVVVTGSYDAVNCTSEKPLHVVNSTSKTVGAIRWDLEAYVPVHTTNMVNVLSEEYKSDVILKPNQFASNRYPMPKLNANVDPTLLEFKIARPQTSLFFCRRTERVRASYLRP